MLSTCSGCLLAPWSVVQYSSHLRRRVVESFRQSCCDGHPLVSQPRAEPSLPPPSRVGVNIHQLLESTERQHRKSHAWVVVAVVVVVVVGDVVVVVLCCRVVVVSDAGQRDAIPMSTKHHDCLGTGALDGRQLLAIEGSKNSAETWHSTSNWTECEAWRRYRRKNLPPPPPHEHVRRTCTRKRPQDQKFTCTCRKMREIRPKATN